MSLVMATSVSAATAPDELPPPESLSANLVAVVLRVPVSTGRITVPEFRHALVLVAAQSGLRTPPKPEERGYRRLAKQALSSQLEAVWLRGQATMMGVSVTRRQVSRQVALIKSESFKNGAEFRRFLREAHFTRRDVYERVELQMLSFAIQRRLSGKSQQEIQEFTDAFIQRWRELTVCAPDYAIDRCSNGPPPSGPHVR